MNPQTRPETTEGGEAIGELHSELFRGGQKISKGESGSESLRKADSASSTKPPNVAPVNPSQIWLDRVIRNADGTLSYAKPLSNRFNVDILLAGAAPVSIMLIYLSASLLRAFALFLTPVALLSPLYPLYRASWSSGVKFFLSAIYTFSIMMVNVLGVVSFPVYFVLEAIPQIMTTTLYLMLFGPGLIVVAVSLTLLHRFTA